MKITYTKKIGRVHALDQTERKRRVMATPRAVAALQGAGAKVEIIGESVYLVTRGKTMPPGIHAAVIGGTARDIETYLRLDVKAYLRLDIEAYLRLDAEAPLPIEIDQDNATLDWTPCPVCGATLVCAVAGHVPGHRVCARAPYHHVATNWRTS